MTIHNKQWHNFAASEAPAPGDIMSESIGGIISVCPGTSSKSEYYSRDRAVKHPQADLANYSGIFQADAYEGYG